MKVLAHIHTFNDADVIQTTLGAVLGQTVPPDRVLIVDNASTDGTLDFDIPEGVAVVRQEQNLGTSGAVHIGLRYGLDHGYDWVWTFDADSAPRPDALAKLLEFYDQLPEDQRERTACVASLPIDAANGRAYHGLRIRPGSYDVVEPSDDLPWYRCDVTMWTGAMFKLAAMRDFGLPSMDYVLDWGEYEYGYRRMLAGYDTYIHTESILDHDVRGPSLSSAPRRFGPIALRVLEMPPIRAYYYIRNNLNFWLYRYRGPRRLTVSLLRLYKCAKLIGNAFLVRENRGEMLGACLRGYWDGVFGLMHKRF